MQRKKSSIDLLAQDFNARSFLMHLRRENERNCEISKYSTFNNSRGFVRLIEFQPLNSRVSSHMTSEQGIMITNELSQQLLDENLILVRYHWQRSKMAFAKKIEGIQSDLNLQTNTSFKRTVNGCHKLLFNWISKNRFR
jgi:hypothetical protein